MSVLQGFVMVLGLAQVFGTSNVCSLSTARLSLLAVVMPWYRTCLVEVSDGYEQRLERRKAAAAGNLIGPFVAD